MSFFRMLSLILLLSYSPFNYAMRMLNVSEGEAYPLNFEQNIGTVFLSDPRIADYQVVDSNKVVVFGKVTGTSALIIYDEKGGALLSRKIRVNRSLENVQQQVQLHFPEANVKVSNIGEQVVLSGFVSTDQEKESIYHMVGELLAKSSKVSTQEWKTTDETGGEVTFEFDFMTKREYSGLVNHIEVAITKQVNVKLTVAEVTHSFLEEFGIQLGSSGRGTGVFVDQLTSFSASDIVSVITAVGDDTVGQVLAEPNLSVISGESASFLVGGELPVVTIVDGGTNVEYKDFGIKLDVAAKVLRDDKIKLALMPEVSALDTQYANETYNLPSLKTRRARTTIELADGQSFMLGGLLNTEEREVLRRIPFVGDIPVLGAIFRHTLTERVKTELVIVATVNLIQPVEMTEVQLPSMSRTSTLHRFFGVEPKQVELPWVDTMLSEGGFKL